MANGRVDAEEANAADHAAGQALRHARDLSLIVRTKRGRGTDADTWTLTESQDPVGIPRRPRKVFAVRSAFRELGIPAALVYEILEETQGEPLGVLELSRRARIGRTSAHEALETLANWGLATHDLGKGWVQGKRSLTAVAVLVGADQAAAAQHRLHKDRRTKWRNWLAKRAHEPATLAREDDHYPFWLFDPGPVDPHSPP
ncbi:helix-turn-helix domain-containing protein [Arthrobacter sp. 2MCAF14]|uniref:helix-turn-helix domain-containing protein n=1 Tax=Arthrobacter sp. 2MCAF14 TaxID=3232982 RepID=UPI003F91099A